MQREAWVPFPAGSVQESRYTNALRDTNTQSHRQPLEIGEGNTGSVSTGGNVAAVHEWPQASPSFVTRGHNSKFLWHTVGFQTSCSPVSQILLQNACSASSRLPPKQVISYLIRHVRCFETMTQQYCHFVEVCKK